MDVAVEQSTVDPASVALDLWNRLTPKGQVSSKDVFDATLTEDVEQVNAFGVYTKGRDAVWSTAQKTIGATKTVGFDSEVVSATVLAPDVLLAHVLSSAESGLGGAKMQFRFMLVIVRQDGAWKIRSSETTLVQPPPA